VTVKKIFILLALLYAVGAVLSAWNIIVHTQASTQAIEQVLTTYNLKNEVSKPSIVMRKNIPSSACSSPRRSRKSWSFLPGGVHQGAQFGRQAPLENRPEEAFVAAWWSWFLLNLSLVYAVAVIALQRSFTTRAVLFR